MKANMYGMKFRHFSFMAILFSFLLQPITAAQSTYYVSTSGNDSNSGLSSSNAFEKLQHAADIVQPGDSVLVLEGEYAGFDLWNGGEPGSPVVFKAEGSVTINEPNQRTGDGINLEGAGYVTIDGFKVNNQPRTGIRAVEADFVIIRNNQCSGNGKWGILTGFTDDILIENNICTFSEDEHGIYFSNSGDRPVIRNNTCYGNNACGIQLNADASLGGDGIISNAVIEGNILHDNGNGGGAAINMDGVQESDIYNNLIYNNHATGIAMWQSDGADGSKNNKIYNNTIINPENSRWGISIIFGSTGNTLYNNIIINHHGFRGSISIDESSTEGFISDYNILVDRLSNDDGESSMQLSEWNALGYDVHSQIADPESEIFVDYLDSDFHLSENSQAVNKGTFLVSTIITEDIDNTPRAQGDAYDIGAFELIDNSNSVEDHSVVNSFDLLQNYPNPFNGTTIIKYQVKNQSQVTLKIYDILGNEVAVLVNEEKPAGSYEVSWNTGSTLNGLTSGVYFYELKTFAGGNPSNNFSAAKKLILMK